MDRADSPSPSFLAGGGEMGALMRAHDWARTPIGPVESWSLSLRMMASFLLANRFPLLLWWGPQFCQLYNDAYRPVLGTKHPRSLGQPAAECWPEIWHIIGPLIETPYSGGPATWMEDIPLEVNRHDFVEETHFTIAYSPVPDETAPRGIGGVLATVHEITEKVVGERRVVILRDLGARSSAAKTADEACALAAAVLAQHAKDVPFALLYLVEGGGRTARLAGFAGARPGEAASPGEVSLAGDAAAAGWPLAEAKRRDGVVVIDDLAERFAAVPPGPWADPPRCAVVVPIRSNRLDELAGFLVAGVSPRLRLDPLYCSFLELVAAQIATSIATARAYEEERRRAEALAEIDRAKTAFFSNVSHEFRTPLTLMLGPLEELQAQTASSSGDGLRPLVDTAQRNGLRLLKLVNSLLDFSRIEAGRVEATYEPTDLAGFTAELASSFRSAIDRAGLRLVIDCAPLPEPFHVDRDMWEKIVLNLLSNAFKFTFEGEIAVELRRAPDGWAELAVRDTGTGIPAAELPRLFERFHRVEGAKGRTFEGSGIGLALVQELVKLHGGTIRVESELGRGSAFIVRIPGGTAHLPAHRLGDARGAASTGIRAQAYVEEALRWLPDGSGAAVAIEEAASPSAVGDLGLAQVADRIRGRILVADDNADMRDYVRRLLTERGHQVETAADGAAALAAARRRKPDLVLSDVMMPQLDGFGLVRALRGDAELADLPIILLSARAGEVARIEGLDVGADDYLIKPFSARELTARVAANLQMSRLRREAAAALRARTTELETVLETVPTAVWITYDQSAARILSNRYAEKLLRLPAGANVSMSAPADERPRHLRFFIDGAEAAPAALPVQRAARGEEVRGEELEIRFADGSVVTTLVYATPLRGPSGEVVGGVAAATDITARKAAEAALRRLNETLEERVAERSREIEQVQDRLRQAQKMEAIGQLTGGVAHDFNNLLHVILTSLELARRRLSTLDAPAAREFLRLADAASRSGERAAILTQRLLAFSRRQPLDPKPTDVSKLVGGMSELLRRTLGETIAIETVIAARLWHVSIDANQLENAILNLAVNARDAMPKGGRLTVETANVTIDPSRGEPRPDLAPGEYVVIAVSDSGIGMSKEVSAQAFEPFFTTKGIGEGTGLGLSQVYGFVKQSGGHVAIHSELGRGTTVKIYLPRLAEAAAAESLAVAPLPPRSHAGELILLVEDDDEVRRATSEYLEELGYGVVSAAESGAALRLLEERPEIRLLFTDVGLPGALNGRQLAATVRALRPTLPVLFTTGYATSAIARAGRLEPGIELLMKPFTYAALAAKLRDLLRREPQAPAARPPGEGSRRKALGAFGIPAPPDED